MSSRAVRKALKQREAEVRRVAALTKEGVQDEVDSEEEDISSSPFNPFSVLSETTQEHLEEVGNAVEPSASTSPSISTLSLPSTKSKSKSRSKKKGKGASKDRKDGSLSQGPTATLNLLQNDDLEDDIDQAIKEISLKYPDDPPDASLSASISISQCSPQSDFLSLLQVQIRHLDANLEMRRLFGKIVEIESRSSTLPVRDRNLVARIKHLQKADRKHVLMKPRDEWRLFSAFNKGNLNMEILRKHEGCTEFKFVHHRTYQDIEAEFFMAVLGGDPGDLMEILRKNPLHMDTCIAVSEIFKHQGSLSEASDLIERAIFAFDCGLHAQFQLQSGTVRLPFKYFENRSFYLAVWYHMEALGRRGCWRTGFEFNKVLLTICPLGNPYAALLSIDFYALRAKEYSYLVKLTETLEFRDEISELPNIAYGKALAEWHLAEDSKSGTAASEASLKEAIFEFPWIVAPLLFALSVPVPAMFPVRTPPSQLQALLTDLYVYRSKDSWNIPEASDFLGSVAAKVGPLVPEYSRTEREVPQNIARHIYIMGVPSLIGHIPKEYTQGGQLASDPLPPIDSISPYDRRISFPQEGTREIANLGVDRLPGGWDAEDGEEEDTDIPLEARDANEIFMRIAREEHDREILEASGEGLMARISRRLMGYFGTTGGSEEESANENRADDDTES